MVLIKVTLSCFHCFCWESLELSGMVLFLVLWDRACCPLSSLISLYSPTSQPQQETFLLCHFKTHFLLNESSFPLCLESTAHAADAVYFISSLLSSHTFAFLRNTQLAQFSLHRPNVQGELKIMDCVMRNALKTSSKINVMVRVWGFCAQWMRTRLSPRLSHTCFACKADTSHWGATVGAPVWATPLWPTPSSGQAQDNWVQLGLKRGKNLWGAGETTGVLTAKKILYREYLGDFFFVLRCSKVGQMELSRCPSTPCQNSFKAYIIYLRLF